MVVNWSAVFAVSFVFALSDIEITVRGSPILDLSCQSFGGHMNHDCNATAKLKMTISRCSSALCNLLLAS